MKIILLSGFLLLRICAYSQNLQWSTPIEVPSGGNLGSTRPRVAISNNVPVIIWSNDMDKKIYSSRYYNNSFSTPVMITPMGFEAFTADWTGPEIDAKGDTVFVSFTDNNTPPGPAYVVRSIDGGISFGDTVRIPLMNDDVPRFPAVVIDDNANPIVTLMRFDGSFANPFFTVSKSMNGGNSFMPYVNATSAIQGEPCDCCPGAIVSSGNSVAVMFRNNDNNIRDIWTALSYDGGSTFTQTARLDSNNWMIMSCPSSGPDGHIYDDTLVSVFMNGNGGNNVYVASMDLNTMQVQGGRKVFTTPNTANQNYPRIDGDENDLATVWQQLANGDLKVLFSYSYDGPTSIGDLVDTLTLSMSGAQVYPDVTVGNGKVHVVFEDVQTQKVYYMNADFGESTFANNSIATDERFVLAQSNSNISLTTNQNINDLVEIKIYDLLGRTVLSKDVDEIKAGERISFDTNSLSNSFYLASIVYDNRVQTFKLVVKH